MADNMFTASTTGASATSPTTFNLSGLKESTDWTVDPKTQTVSGQLESVLASDSPLIQQARSRALQSMNSRGLMNSSMATGAADSAMYDVAMPIAQGNAAVYGDAAKTNAAQKNQFSLAANNQAYDLQKMGVQQDYTQQNMATQQTYAQRNMNLEQRHQLARMAAAQGYNLETMDQQQINDLAKMAQAQTDNLETLGAQFKFDVRKMNVQTRNALATMDADQQNQLARMAAAQGYNLETMAEQQVNDLAKMAQAQADNLATLGAQFKFDVRKMNVQTRNTLSTMTAEQQNRMATLAAQQGYNLETMNLQQTLDIAKLDKQTAAAIQIADIEAAYKNLTQASASATSIFTKMQSSLDALAANKDITDQAVRDSMAADIKTNAMDALSLIGALAGDVDLGDFIDGTVGDGGEYVTLPYYPPAGSESGESGGDAGGGAGGA